MIGEDTQSHEEETSELIAEYKVKATSVKEKLHDNNKTSAVAIVNTLLKILEKPKTVPRVGINYNTLVIWSNSDDPTHVLTIGADEANDERTGQATLHLIIFDEPYWYSVNGEAIQVTEATHRKVEPVDANENQIRGLQQLLLPFAD